MLAGRRRTGAKMRDFEQYGNICKVCAIRDREKGTI